MLATGMPEKNVWKEDCKMRKKDSLILLDSVKKYISAVYGFRVEYSFSDLVGNGSFANVGTSKERLIVGTSGLSENEETIISLAEGVTPVVDAYHELGHAVHFHELYFEKSDLSKAIALSNAACLCSPGYYFGCGHKSHPHEIAAEYFGFYGADRFLSGYFDRNMVDRMLCDYANQKSPYFPDGSHFTSVPDILKDLDSQFKDSVLQHKYYDRKSDPFVVVREREGYNRDPVSEGLLHFASTAGYGMLQDYAMSVMSLAYLESHVYRGKPVFRSMEMDPGNALQLLKGMVQSSYPKPKRENLSLSATEQAFRMAEEIDRNDKTADGLDMEF